MKKTGAFLARHRTLFLLTLMLSTLLISSAANRHRLADSQQTTALPVMHVQQGTSPVAAYISDRDAAHLQDIAALTALVDQPELDSRTREDAASQLRALIANREAALALEDALASTALAPCSAVVCGGSVTLVTQKAEITAEDSALVLSLAVAHTGAKPEDVRILPAE